MRGTWGKIGGSFAILLALLASPALAEPVRTITGPARILDGDTLAIDGTKVRLSGLHAPEIGEPGGVEAKRWMEVATRGQVVTCSLDGSRTRDRWASICSTPAGDLAAGLVAAGLGRDCPRYSRGRYARLERPEAARMALPAYCVRRSASPAPSLAAPPDPRR